MIVFVAGASGAIGRPLIAELVRRGHTVTGMTRSDAGTRALADIGAAVAGSVHSTPRGWRKPSGGQVQKSLSTNSRHCPNARRRWPRPPRWWMPSSPFPRRVRPMSTGRFMAR